MLSLRQVQSVDVSSTRADEFARSKEFSLANSDFRHAFKFSVIFRLTVVVAGLSLSLFGAQMAMAQLFGACLLYMPTHHYLAINTLIVAVPALLFSLLSVGNNDYSPKHQLSMTVIFEALVVSLAALALRFNCQPMIVIVLSIAALALGNCAFVKSAIKIVPIFPEVETFNGFNGYFCAFGLCSVLAAVFLVKTISFALPGGLEIAASFILLGGAMVFNALPESNDQNAKEPIAPAQNTPLVPFLVPASMTAIPVFTVLLLTLERNWVLFPQLMHILQTICAGAIVGSVLSVLLIGRRLQLSQLSLPALIALALAFVMAISPSANQGVTADVCLEILGVLFVYSNVQLLTRAQSLFRPVELAHSARLTSICAIIAVSFFVISLEPFLDTISATIVVRFLGLEIVVAGSVALAAVLIWHNRTVNPVNIQDSSDKSVEDAHDFCASGVAARMPAE